MISLSVPPRRGFLVAMLACASLPLAARAVEVPATVVVPETQMVAWMDLAAPGSKEAAKGVADFAAGTFLMGFGANQNAAPPDALSKAVAAFHESFTTGGGQGLLLTVDEGAGKDSAGHLLVKVKPGSDRAKLEKVFQILFKDAKAAMNGKGDAKPEDLKLAAYGKSAEWLVLTAGEMKAAPLTGAGKEAAAVNKAFAADPKAGLQFHLRMTPKMKATAKAEADAAQQRNAGNNNLPAEFGIMMTTLSNAQQALPDLDTLVVFGHGDKGVRKLSGTAHFANPGSAVSFSGAANGLVQAYKGMMTPMLGQMAKFGVNAAVANAVFDGLSTQAKGQEVSAAVDEKFIANLALFANQMQKAQRQQMAEFRNQNGNFNGGGDAPPVDLDADE